MFLETDENAKHVDNHEEYQYLNLINKIIKDGSWELGRNGNTKVIIGESMRFSLKDNQIPLLTTKKLAWKTCLKELFWFIKGSTDNGELTKQNVKIWNGNASKEFKELSNLHYDDENDLGPIYGHQWRFYNAEYTDCHTDYSGKGVDQLQDIIDNLKSDVKRTSRRLILCAWNPCQIQKMALPPCHILAQFHVTNNNELSCTMYQRSCDMGLGVPFNIASYSFLTHLIAHHCGLKAKEFIYFLGNAHIYDDHIQHLGKQLSNLPLKFPKIHIKSMYDDINSYSLEDIEISDYKHCETINMNMRN